MARARKCSELSETVAKLALEIARDPAMKNLDDVVKVIEKDFPVLNRDEVVKAINEFTHRDPVERDEIDEKLTAMKEEAHDDARLTKQIEELEQHIEAGTRPEARVRASDQTEAIKAKMAQRDALRKQLPKGDELSKARIQKQIDALTKHIDEGTAPKPVPRNKVYTEAMKKLMEIRNDLKKRLSGSDQMRAARILNQTARLEKILREGVQAPVKKPPDILSKELFKVSRQRDRLRAEINGRIRDQKPKTIFGRVWHGVGEVLTTPRTIMTMADFSAVLRQAGFVVVGHPVLGAKAIPDMLRSTFSAEKAHQYHEELLDRPNAPLYKASGLYIAEHEFNTKTSDREEVFQNNLVDKIWGVGHIKRASERNYVTFLNRVRADLFDTMAKTMSKSGTPTLEEAQHIAKFINAATGRGSFGSYEHHASELSKVFFSPKFLASRIQLVTGGVFRGGSLRTKKAIAVEYARYLAGMAVIYGIASLDDKVSVEFDPRSSDFGKIRIGNTRVDPLSGLAQVMVLGGRTISRESKSSTTGGVFSLTHGKYGSPDMGDTWMRFARSKLAPIPGLIATAVTGKNYSKKQVVSPTAENKYGFDVGKKETSMTAEAAQSLYPMVIGDIYKAMQELDVPHTTAVAMLSLMGMSVQTYDDDRKGHKPKPHKERK